MIITDPARLLEYDEASKIQESSGFRDAKGRFTQCGNPKGKPKGTKNRFTLIQNEMLELWEEEIGKEKLRELIQTKKGFKYFLDHIVTLMPKKGNGISIKNYVVNRVEPNGSTDGPGKRRSLIERLQESLSEDD